MGEETERRRKKRNQTWTGIIFETSVSRSVFVMAGELHSLNKSKNFFLLSPNHINNVLEEGVGGGGGQWWLSG